MAKNELTDKGVLAVANLLEVRSPENWDIDTLRQIIEFGYGKEGQLATAAVLDAINVVVPTIDKKGVYQEVKPQNLTQGDWQFRTDCITKFIKRNAPKEVEYQNVGAGTRGTDPNTPFILGVRRKQAA